MLVYIGNAQSYNTPPNNDKLVQNLQSHILINPDNIVLSSIQSFLQKKSPIAIELLKVNDSNLSFIKECLKYNNPLVIVFDKNIDSLFKKTATIIQVYPNEIETLNMQALQLSDSIPIRFTGNKQFVRVNFKNNNTVTDSLFLGLWNRLGKLPNFIYADSTTLEKVDSIVSKINSTSRVFGVVRTENELLQNVSFKNFKDQKVTGYFSFPIDEKSEELPVLIPHKSGYYFSPDIIYITSENYNNLKEFTGFPLDPEYGLSDYFKFGATIKNAIRKNNDEIISNGVLIKQDNIHGAVGFFSERAYIDTGLQNTSVLKSSFTITAWIKPTTLHYANSILGKGKNFVLKIHEGFLTFTMAGVKDYISYSSPIPINKWTYIALVHSKTDNELLFYINGKQTDRVKLIADYETSDYNLLIGSNLWEEFFIGYLGDIKIWERELNDIEIQNQYNKSLNQDTALFTKTEIRSVAILLVAILSFFYFKYKFQSKKKQQTNYQKKSVPNYLPIPKNNKLLEGNYKEQIVCFGKLQIFNNEGIDIAKKLSPKLKNLFIIIFLHSYESKKGINSKKLTELLWPGMSVESAKNTRGTNIQNLRSILASCSEIKLIFKDKYWVLKISDACYCDYHLSCNYIDFLSTENYSLIYLENKLPTLLSILKGGRFLANTNDAWLDPFIEKFSNQIIEQCLQLTEKLDVRKHSDLLFDIAEVIYIYDDLHEKALRIKLQVLIQQGKLSLAHTVHANFAKLYKKLYNETYAVSFEDVVSEN